ncbi:hypothetical protein CVT24_008854 [Panaeolus cyanescens]|uniref:Uncharacterized protein n=1 Tax=Panaeolus cyanescens TaxID=181874 RepID=A0A409VAV1_9AGAR|nr:hypothetical protein CVT24_008854 [Panaeolus cyanescens]
MSLNPAWRPNLTEVELFEERTWLQGGILSAVAYGMVFTLFILNFSLLKDRINANSSLDRRRMNIVLLIYVCVMFILSTLTMASQAQMTQLGFVDNRNFPGGPGAFQKDMFSLPISNLGNVCFSLMNWFADLVLMWRCTVIYKTCRYSLKVVMFFPMLMYIASFVTGIIYLEQISRPGASPWATENFTFIYSVISLGLNILLTLMIVIRLFLHRRRIVKAIGQRHGIQYTSIIAILVESAFILDVIVLLFIIPFAVGSPLANTFLSTLVQVQPIMLTETRDSWRPDAPSSQLFAERTWLQGSILSAVTYGVNLTLFTLNVVLLTSRTSNSQDRDSVQRSRNLTKRYLLIYVLVMFILSTLTMASQAKMTELGFVDNRNFPGGPSAYEAQMFSIPISSMGNVCFSIMNWLSDCLLVNRKQVNLARHARTMLNLGSMHSGWFILPISGFSSFNFALGCEDSDHDLWNNQYITQHYAHLHDRDKTLPTPEKAEVHLRPQAYVKLCLVRNRHAGGIRVFIGRFRDLLFDSICDAKSSGKCALGRDGSDPASFLIIFRVAQGKAWKDQSEDNGRGSTQFSMIRFSAPSTQTIVSPLEEQRNNVDARPDPEIFKTNWTLTERTETNDSV